MVDADAATCATDLPRPPGVPLAHAVRTDVGRVRANNEDCHGLRWLADGSLLVIVADGMGGHEAGEVASGLAVEVVEQAIEADASAAPQQALYDALLAAHRAILDASRQRGRRGMGTTAVVAWIRGEEVHVGLVGDSRLYHVRDGAILERTVDHTRVQGLIEKGTITAAEARDHPDAGMLTRALGHARMSNGRPLEPEVFAEPLRLQPGDALVLSTDGLHDLVDDGEIAAAVGGASAVAATDALVQLALDRGGHDNVTVAVVTRGPHAGERTGDETPQPVAYEPPPPGPVSLRPAPGGDDRMLLLATVAGTLLLVVSALLLLLALGLVFG